MLFFIESYDKTVSVFEGNRYVEMIQIYMLYLYYNIISPNKSDHIAIKNNTETFGILSLT